VKKLAWVLAIVITVVASGISFAASETEEAKEMVEKAVAYYQANGKEKALKEVPARPGHPPRRWRVHGLLTMSRLQIHPGRHTDNGIAGREGAETQSSRG
jgi:hypothetical protein